MPVDLPDLNDRRVERISIYAVFPSTEPISIEIPTYPEKAEAEFSYSDTQNTCYGTLSLLRFEDGDVSCQIALYRKSYFVDHVPDERPIESTDVLRKLDVLLGRQAILHIFADYRCEQDELPKKGIVLGVAGVAAEVDGAELAIRGADLSITSAEPFRQLSWTLDEEELSVIGRIAASRPQLLLTETFVHDALELVESGIDRFLLEKGNVDE